MGTLIAVAGAAMFSVKSFVYRLLRKEPLVKEIEPDIAIQDKRSGKYDPILQAGINYISGRIG